jgi:antitoxin (DNA-binding transcriptional repressor) of toxin-antitoxin stability system
MKHDINQSFVHESAAEYSAMPEHGPVIVSIHEAKTNLSKLVKRAAAGETIYIGAYGMPEVVLTVANRGKYRAKLREEAFGGMKGKMELSEGWDDPLPDTLIDSFYRMQGLEDFEVK